MRRNLLILLTIIISTGTIAQDTKEGVVVLELFTSQGCSSCPPADDVLDAVKKEYENEDVFVLSYHVDYWNRLGWKDPFSDAEFSDYQRDYALQFNSRSIYTPQLVVNGSEHFTGSNSTKTKIALRDYGNTVSLNSIRLQNTRREKEVISVDYAVTGEAFNQITFALVIAERITKVARGENSRRTLKNANIVASRLVKTVAGGTAKLAIPNWVDPDDELSIIAYTQNKKLQVTGANKKGV